MDYPWITEAQKYVGLKEIPGPKHNNTIQKWLVNLRAWWTDDETPWCGVYVGHCFKAAGMNIPKYYMRAKAWSESWGTSLSQPVDGCVVVFDRQGGGHVGFVMGVTNDSFLAVLGGNQGNAVTVAKFDRNRVVGFYWPKEVPTPTEFKLSRVSITGGVSTNEA